LNSASPDLVDRGSFGAIAGAGWDQSLEGRPDRHAITLGVTPLGIERVVCRILGHHSGEIDPASLWSRVAARVTVGGPAQFVDSLRATRPARVTDHVTSQLELRLSDGGAPRGRPSGEMTPLALALTADNLGTGYGLDRYAATLIGEREAGCIWTGNAGYRVVERYKSSVRLAETRLGIGLRRPFMAPARRDRRIDFTLSGDCLLRNRSRGALWQAGARMDVAIPAGLELSIAARASEHAEIPGDRRFRGVLSLAYDLDRVVH